MMAALFVIVCTMTSAVLMIFNKGPLWIKPMLIFVGIIVAIIYAIANNYRSDDRVGEDSEKAKGKSKKSKDEPEEPPKEEKLKDEFPKEEKKKEESKKTTDAKKHPWQESSTGGVGALIIVILVIGALFYSLSDYKISFTSKKPEVDSQTQFVFPKEEVSFPRKSDANGSKEDKKSKNADVKDADTESGKQKTVHVEYKWTETEQGVVNLGTFAPGDYKVEVSESDFEHQTLKNWQVIRTEVVGPEGMAGRIVRFQSELPVSEAQFLARIIRVNERPWQLLGSSAIIHLDKTSDVFVTINVRRNPDNFHNQGGDTIKIKRSGQ